MPAQTFAPLETFLHKPYIVAPAILTAVQVRAADTAQARAGVGLFTLMRRAGRAVASLAMEIVPRQADSHPRIVVLCGPGNNGGDGFVAAHALALHGYDPHVLWLGRQAIAYNADGASNPCRDARSLYESVRDEGACVGFTPATFARALDGASLVVDALFGTGLKRPLSGEAREAVRLLNAWRVQSDVPQSQRPVLSVDMPSGLDADTGAVMGEAVAASHTLALYALKPTHVLLPGSALCGALFLAELGMAAHGKDDANAPAPDAVKLNTPALWRAALPCPGAQTHKYTRGSALVLAGTAHRSGAARLCARACLRAGAGIVALACPSPESLNLNAARLEAIMVKPCFAAGAFSTTAFAALLDDPRLAVLVLGPGSGAGEEAPTRVALTIALTRPPVKTPPPALVLDADAITVFAGDAKGLQDLIRQGASANANANANTCDARAIILTPHEGEFARLFAGMDAVVNAPSKIARARAAARMLGAAMLVKGADTVIALPDGTCFCHHGLSPHLATAGSGDALSGILAGLLAQGMPLSKAACAAVMIHSACAAAIGQGFSAEDFDRVLPQVLRAYGEGNFTEGRTGVLA